MTTTLLGFGLIAMAAIATATPPEGRIAVQVDKKHEIHAHALEQGHKKSPAHIKVKVVKVCDNVK